MGRTPAAAVKLLARRCIRPVKLLFALLMLSFALPAHAQNEIVTIRNGRVHTGDNPAWAKPDFDDSQWTKIDFRQMNSFGLMGGTRWYRATFQVPADFAGQDLAIGVGPIDQVYDVYIDGVRVGGYGSWAPAPHGPFPRHMVFPLPAGVLKGSVGHIAIRRWKGGAGLDWLTFGLSGYTNNGHAPEIGARAAIDARERLHPAAGAIQNLPWDLTFVIYLFAA